MNPLCFVAAMLVSLAPVPSGPQSHSFGPTPPELKGLHKPLPLATSVAALTRATVGELGGSATVMVEDELPRYLPKSFANLELFGSKLRLFKAVTGQPGDMPVLPWMDTGTVRSGGNVAQRSYPLGWGY